METQSLLIDEFLPRYDVETRHEIDIKAPIERVYEVVRNLDLRQSWLIRGLFFLRGLPARLSRRQGGPKGLGLTLNDLQETGFILLGEKPPEELLLGVVGRFWTPAGDLQRLDASEFQAFDRSGYAKAVWYFNCSQAEGKPTRLLTETRVLSMDEVSGKQFQRYWVFIGIFSGLIRYEALRIIKRQAESSRDQAQP